MTDNYLEQISKELNIPITYKTYKGVENVRFLNNLAIAYNTIDEKCQPCLETNLKEFPTSCTKSFIKDCLEAECEDLGVIHKINWQYFKDKTFVIADIETTGFSPNLGGQIIQIGALKIDEQGNEISRFDKFIKPTIKIPQKITNLTGITNEMVQEAEPMGVVLREFLQFFKGSTIVFHNAPFDWDRYIIPFAERIGIKIPMNYPCIDTKIISRYLWPNEKKHDLESMCNRLNIDIKDHHNAFADVVMTAKAFINMRELCKDNFNNLPYIIWKFTAPKQHNIKILKVNRWDKWMPKKKVFSKLRFYIDFVYDGVWGQAYYDFIEKQWYCKNFAKSFDVNELEKPIFEYFKVSSYEELLEKIPSKNNI